MSDRLKGIFLASTTALLWGFLAIALKVADTNVDPLTIVWFRFTLAFSLLAIYHAIKAPKELNILRKPPLLLVLAAIALSCNYMGYMNGIHYTSPGNTQIIIQTGPILLGAYGFLIFKERLSKKQIFGFVVASIGFLVFYRQQLKMLIGDEQTYNIGVWWVIFGATTWSVYAALQKVLVRTHKAQTLNMFLYGLPSLAFLPWVDFQSLGSLSVSGWALMAFLGLNTLVAYGTLGASFKYIEANKISIIITLNPIITFGAMAVLSALDIQWIDAEKLNTLAILGGLLVLAGAILVVSKRKEQNNK
ncbi:DMT family transporter [Prolixibacteraceae bacterium JC049]|nr:DMT family transporter [Prolixibacteraceae bacterium JC049]